MLTHFVNPSSASSVMNENLNKTNHIASLGIQSIDLSTVFLCLFVS
jgi:hypothetical protein